MEEADDTAIGSEGRSAAVAERAEDRDSDAENFARILADFQLFAAKHSVSLVRITIQELMDDLAKRGRLLAGDAVGAVVVWDPLESSVMTGFRRQLIALMTLSLFFFENTEWTFIFIFCICKYSLMTIRKTMKLICENNYKS